MKTNYEHSRTTEGRETINKIAEYATKNMNRTKKKCYHYARIINACNKDLALYGIEKD